MLQRREIELCDVVECLRAGEERHLRAALLSGIANNLQRRDGIAVVKFDEVLFAFAPDPALEPRRERIDDRHADAMQTARHLVGVLIEFPARVQLREDDLGGRALRIVIVVALDAGRDAAAIVAHRARPIGVERHDARLRMARENLVDAVIDHLVDHVMQARPVVGIADVHAGTLAHRIEPLQHLDAVFAVVFGRGFLERLCGHFLAFSADGNSIVFYSTNRLEKPQEIDRI